MTNNKLCNTASSLKAETSASVELEQKILLMKNWFRVYACLYKQLGLLEAQEMQLLC